MRTRNFTFVAAVVVTTMSALSGCSSGEDGRAGQKSGGDSAPRTLRLGTVEESSAPYAAEVLYFADAVEEKSGGSLVVEVVWAAGGDYNAQTEQLVATMVQSGELDAAIVPTRVWDKLDVTSMQALQTPFLIDNLGLLDAVATAPVAADMLAGLAPIGIEGLALWPESLRHPIGMNRLLVTADDFVGAKLRVPISDLSEQLARAIGAEPVDPEDWTLALAAGELDGFESAFLWSHDMPAFGTFTANITFYPKVNTVTANAGVFAELSDEQQLVLRDAATDTIAFIEGAHDTERELAAGYCDAGGGVALASEADIAELVTKAAPVVAALDENATTKQYVEQIREIKAGLTVDPSTAPAECELAISTPDGSAPPTTQAPVDSTATSTESGEFPEGVYRVIYGDEFVVTMEFVDGVWQGFLNGELDCSGTYYVEAGRIVLVHSNELSMACGGAPGEEFLGAEWTLEGDQLRFVNIDSDPDAQRDFGAEWTKIE